MFRTYSFIIILVLSLCSCQNINTEMAVTNTQTPFATTSFSPPAEVTPSEEWTLWSTSKHADTNETEDGQVINCKSCHEENGAEAWSKPVWLNQESGQYEAVENNSALCGQCHQEAESSNHQNENSIHIDFECTDCHNPHSTAASCSNTNCHQSIKQERVLPPSTPTGGQHPKSGTSFCGGASCHPAATQVASFNHSIHGSIHAAVSCAACHDASELQVAPSEQTGTWVTFKATEIDGVITSTPYESHNLQAEVSCIRCHFEGNSWGLSIVAGDEFK